MPYMFQLGIKMYNLHHLHHDMFRACVQPVPVINLISDVKATVL